MSIRSHLRRTDPRDSAAPQLRLLPAAEPAASEQQGKLLQLLPWLVGQRRASADSPLRPRFELKAVTAPQLLPDLKAWLLVQPDGFYERHEPRRVNSIYYDSADLRCYADNLSGASERRKLRLRWYGRKTSKVKGVLEAKRKRNKLGWKASQRIPGRLDLASTTWVDLRVSIRESLSGALRLTFDEAGDPVLCIRYQREYYESADGLVRLTIDSSVRSYDQRGTDKPNFDRPSLTRDVIVVEIKADASRGDRVAQAISELPLRVVRHSKYAAGMAAALGA